jgi:hypothetical protein
MYPSADAVVDALLQQRENWRYMYCVKLKRIIIINLLKGAPHKNIKYLLRYT